MSAKREALHFLLILLVAVSACALKIPQDGCPKSCSCSSDFYHRGGLRVNCSWSDLHEVPDDIPVNTTTLYLTHNQLKILRNNSFSQLTSLIELSLSSNNISQLEEDAFVGLSQLRFLSLRTNNLRLSPSTYPQYVFRPLVSLEILHINRMHSSRYSDQTHTEMSKPLMFRHGTSQQHQQHGDTNDHAMDKPDRDVSQIHTHRSDDAATGVLEARAGEPGYPDEALSHLPSLRELFMDGLANISFGPRFASLTNLSTLSVSGNGGICTLGVVTRQMIANLWRVERLNMSECDITSITQDAFSSAVNLRDLDLSFNRKLGFDILGDVFEGLSKIRLESLTIDAVVPDGILGLTINSTHLRHFKNLLHLKKLSARFNRIEAFENGVLCSSVPPNLTTVFLNANLLELAPYVYDIECLTGLDLLHINGFNEFWTPVLRPPDRADQSSEAPVDECSQQRARSRTLYGKTASYQQTLGDEGKEFPVPPKLRIFKARHFGLFYKLKKLRVNPNNSLERIDMGENHFPVWSDKITGLENLRELYLEDTFTSSATADFFASFPSLEKLTISGNQLRNAFRNDRDGRLLRGLGKLKVLDISRNDLGSLPTGALNGLYSLEKLHARINGMARFVCNISHIYNIKHLDLSENQIGTLPKSVRDHLDMVALRHNVSIDMTYNPIACTCQNIDFLKWIRDSSVDFGTHMNYYCQFEDGSLKPMSNILGTIDHLDSNCGSYIGVFVGAVASSLLMLILIVVALVYRFRWKLRYVYYATRLRFQRERRHHDDGFEYDAFVSFAGEDLEFVDGELKNQLEVKRGLRLCIHERDFVPGQYIASNIVDSVQRSRRTLVVLTRALLASSWCHYELQMALMEAAETGRDVLLFLLYEHVPSHELPREVLFNIQAASYIEFPHEESDKGPFWDRLADALKR